MHFSATVIASAAFASLAAAAPRKYNAPHDEVASLFKRQVPVLACSAQTGGVHVIAVPGEGFADPPYGLIGSLATSILNAIPGSTNVSVPYNHSETNGVVQTQQATTVLDQYILQYHNSCPNTKIVLLGYSSGGIAVMNSLCSASSPPYNPAIPALNHNTYGSAVIAAIVYGDETRTSGNSWDKGTCTGVGTHPRANTAGCAPWAKIIRSYCNKEDPACCATTGTDMEAHYAYPSEYDSTATQIVVNKFNRSKTT